MRRPTAAQSRALQKIAESKAEHIIGIDEVGLGCIAGPVVVAAVALPAGWADARVKDSKSISSKKRERADKIVRKAALSFCILPGTNDEIDREGLRKVHARLTEEAALRMLEYFPSALIVQDGDVPVVVGGRPQNMVWLSKADVFVPAVSAASNLAKVYRDDFMQEEALRYPGYGFDTNMGYGTKEHLCALREMGACYLHRKSFRPVRKVL